MNLKKILITFVLMAFPLITNAEQNYINGLGVEITAQELEILNSKGYGEEYIDQLDEYNITQIINSELIDTTTEYIRIDTSYDINGNILYQRNSNVTEEEYNSYEPSDVSPASVAGSHETTYKKIEAKTSKYTNYYFYSFLTTWKKMPANRSVDVMAHRYTNTSSTSSYYIAYNYQLANGNTHSGNCLYVSGCANQFKVFNNGWLGAYQLPTQEIVELSYYSSFNIVESVPSATTYVYSTYQHSTSSVALGNVINTSYINPSGHGSVISFGNLINDKFDQMQGIYVTF